MLRVKGLFLVATSLFCSSLWAYGLGYSTHPMLTKTQLLSAEITSAFNNGGGVGIQARYTNKLLKNLVLDGGAGIATGDRANRIFVGADYEIFPDYMKQPRVSLKTTIEYADEFEVRRTILNLSPTISKGFDFWGQEAFPYASIPLGLSLDTDKNQYLTLWTVVTGFTTPLPWEFDGKKMNASLEAQINLKNSFNGLLGTVSWAL